MSRSTRPFIVAAFMLGAGTCEVVHWIQPAPAWRVLVLMAVIAAIAWWGRLTFERPYVPTKYLLRIDRDDAAALGWGPSDDVWIDGGWPEDRDG
jgi:hypothetical protein